MNAGDLLHFGLLFHIIGFTLVGGSTVVSFTMYGQFWKQYAQDKSKGVAVILATSKVSVITTIGLLLLVVSGISMMLITRGAFGAQVWFRIKMIILLIIIINAVIFGRRNGIALNKLIFEDTNGKDKTSELTSAKARIRIFYISQLFLIVTILMLSVYKFN